MLWLNKWLSWIVLIENSVYECGVTSVTPLISLLRLLLRLLIAARRRGGGRGGGSVWPRVTNICNTTCMYMHRFSFRSLDAFTRCL